MKFFKASAMPEIDQERTLRNEFNDVMLAYIEDKMTSFTDENLIRAFAIIDNYDKSRIIRLSDRLLSTIAAKINVGNFETSSPELIYDLCKAYRAKHHLLSQDLVTNPTNYGPSEANKKASYIKNEELCEMIDKMFIKVMPDLYKHFDSYSPTEQIVILSVYQRLEIFDANLFEIFIRKIMDEYTKADE